MNDINEIVKILQNPEVIYRCKLKNIESIEFEKGFEKDNIIIKFNEKLDFDYTIYKNPKEMTEYELKHMKLDYNIAKKKQRHESICIQHDLEVQAHE